MLGDQGTGQKWIMLGLLRPEGIESNFLCGSRDRSDILQMDRWKCGIEFHGVAP